MTKQFFDRVGKRIRLLRQDLDLNQAALVNELKKQGVDVGSSYISELERTDKVPSGTVLAGLARVLNTTTDYLLLTDDPNNFCLSRQGKRGAGVVYPLCDVLPRRLFYLAIAGR